MRRSTPGSPACYKTKPPGTQCTGGSIVGRAAEILQLAVAVQPGQEHVDAEERERRDQQARER
ncbi:hypothetical protein, partial [Burkholderia sp. Bp8992]|uniref:hypothetical protein n=1 Tax=Burkholderia sp. Bp8992 TaxID=2184554 RepID=UPI001C899A04